MYFAVIYHDKLDSSALRAGIRPSHLAYLTPYLDRIVFAGPLLADDGETSIGGLAVIEYAGLAATTAFAHADPYTVGGLLCSVEVRPWRKVFPASHA